jgi:hypothetical protein
MPPSGPLNVTVYELLNQIDRHHVMGWGCHCSDKRSRCLNKCEVVCSQTELGLLRKHSNAHYTWELIIGHARIGSWKLIVVLTEPRNCSRPGMCFSVPHHTRVETCTFKHGYLEKSIELTRNSKDMSVRPRDPSPIEFGFMYLLYTLKFSCFGCSKDLPKTEALCNFS